MILGTVVVGRLQANCYVLSDGESGKALVVDPGDDPQRILGKLDELGLEVELIVCTHCHIDHVAAAGRVQEATGTPFRIHGDEQRMLAHLPTQARWMQMEEPLPPQVGPPIAHEERLCIGALEVTAIHTPGHTPGGTCYHVASEGLVLTGDTLFAGTIGRSDLPGGDGAILVRSIRERLLTLPPETRVLPGHGPATTVGRERGGNPFL